MLFVPITAAGQRRSSTGFPFNRALPRPAPALPHPTEVRRGRYGAAQEMPSTADSLPAMEVISMRGSKRGRTPGPLSRNTLP